MAKDETKEKFDALSEDPNASKKRMLKKVGVWCAAGVLVAGIALGTGFGIGCNATYTITLNSDTENAQLTGAGKYKKGKEVTISAKDLAGYKFDHWEYKGNKVSDKTQYTFKLTKDTKGEYKAVYTETINLAPSPDNNKVSVDPSQIPNGTMITLTADDRVGYTFKCWKLNGVEVSNQQSYTFTMSTDTAGEYTAEYTINSYTVSVSSDLESAVLTGADTYKYNSTVTVTASDVIGYLFDHWDLDGNNVSSEQSYTFTLSKANNYTLKAVYVNAYNITLTSNIPHVTLTVTGEHKVGEKVTISASDVEGYTFNHWELGGTQVSTDKIYTFIISDTTKGEYKAVYDINTYTVTTTSDTAGATLKGAGTYNYNAEVTLTAEDVEGYTFSHWEYNNTNVSNDKSYTFTMSESTKGEYKAVYTINSYEITVSSDLENAVLSGAGRYNYNAQVTITANDVTGYTFKRWTLNGVEVSTDKSYTFTMSNTTKGEYKAVYDINTYTVTTTSDTAGATLKGAGTYNYNAEVTLTAEDVEGYTFSHWEYNNANVSSNKSYTFTMSESTEGTYKAVYEATITLTLNVDGVATPYSVTKGTTLASALSNIKDGNNQRYTLENTCGFYTCDDMIGYVEQDTILSDSTTIFTKMATLNKLKINNSFANCVDYDISGEVVVPYMYNGVIVSGIGDFYGTNITNIVIPDGVTEIFDEAFVECNLNRLVIPAKVNTIGADAFSTCLKITEVYNLSNIDITADEYGDLGRFVINLCSDAQEKGEFTLLDKKFLMYEYNNNHFLVNYFGSDENVTLPNTNYDYAISRAFAFNSNIKSLITTNSSIYIEDFAFLSCTSLKSVEISSKINNIGYRAFYGCSSLNSATFQGSTSAGWYYAESGSETIGTVIDVTNAANAATYLKNTYLDKYFIKSDSQNTITIKLNIDGVDTPYTVNKGTSLASVLSSIKESGQQKYTLETTCGFYFDSEFKKFMSENTRIYNAITIYTKMATLDKIIVDTSQPEYKYKKKDNNITGEVVLPYLVTRNGGLVKTIGDFSVCKKITSIFIPKSITTIRAEAFWGCSELTDVTILGDITELYDQTFMNCTKLTGISLPTSLTYIGQNTFQKCESLTSIIIPDNVKTIHSSAFAGCTGLTQVKLSSKLETILGGAFSGCTSLTSIIIPKSVKEIGSQAFDKCTNLTSITFEDTTGWQCDGADIDVTDATANATNLKGTYLYSSLIKNLLKLFN